MPTSDWAGATTPGIERAVARLLGAEATIAVAVVDSVENQGRLADGVLLLTVVGAARWGTDAAGALACMADGADAPAGWSDYELRIAAEEAAEESALALGRLRPSAGTVAVSGAEEAVNALRGGAATLVAAQWPGAGGGAERAWVARLCERVGAALVDGAPSTAPALPAVPRSPAYLDLLA